MKRGKCRTGNGGFMASKELRVVDKCLCVTHVMGGVL